MKLFGFLKASVKRPLPLASAVKATGRRCLQFAFAVENGSGGKGGGFSPVFRSLKTFAFWAPLKERHQFQ